MRFNCTKNNLANALSLVGAVAAKNINLPILNNVLIKATEQKVELVATNLELAVVSTVRAKVEQPGEFTVPAKTLADFVNLLPEETITFELSDNELSVACGKSTTKIKGMPTDDYPVIPNAGEGDGYLLKATSLKKGLSQVFASASRNDIRPELSGILFSYNSEKEKQLTMAATDSYRLAEKKISVEQGEKSFRVILPLRTAGEINHVLSLSGEEQKEDGVRIILSDNQIVINYNNAQIISRLVDGEYPDYEQIIPTNFKTEVTFSVAGLTKEIKAASLFSSQAVSGVNFEFDAVGGVIKISSTSTQTGTYSSEVPAEIKGESNQTFLNHRYFLEGLNNLSADEARLEVINTDSPCLLSSQKGEDFKYVIMPIRQ